jgi:cell division protein FtsI/penicillin-binding protein 2
LRPFIVLGGLLVAGVLAAAAADGWWAVVRGPDLLERTDNPRRAIADLYVRRGSILDRNNQVIDETVGSSGSLERVYRYPALAPITGYTHRVFGQAGLEGSLDSYLRGTQGNPASLILSDSLRYGTPPPGLDVRLSIDLEMQNRADTLLGNLRGAVVMLNAQTGEILAMASHPGYDPNQLDQIGAQLSATKDAPLLNRATQALYPVGAAGEPFAMALAQPEQPNAADLLGIYRRLGFFVTPDLRMPVARATSSPDVSELRVSPIQMAIAAAALSHGGLRPVPRIALAVNTPQQGWVVLPPLGHSSPAVPTASARQVTTHLAAPGGMYWEWTGAALAGEERNTWFLGGTLPDWKATPLAVAVLIEGDYPLSAQRIGQLLLQAGMRP